MAVYAFADCHQERPEKVSVSDLRWERRREIAVEAVEVREESVDVIFVLEKLGMAVALSDTALLVVV